jgi:hypothetical protein
MTSDDDRKMLAQKALEKMKWTASNVSADRYVHKDTPLDKHEFVKLLRKNFEKLDRDKNKGISKQEILDALTGLPDFTTDEYVMLQLLVRYFDFISDLVRSDESNVISKQDIDVLEQFLLNSNLTLEALYIWCGGRSEPKPDVSPPPLSSQDSKGQT